LYLPSLFINDDDPARKQRIGSAPPGSTIQDKKKVIVDSSNSRGSDYLVMLVVELDVTIIFINLLQLNKHIQKKNVVFKYSTFLFVLRCPENKL